MKTSSKIPLKASQRKQQQQNQLKRQAKLRSLIMLAIIVATILVDITLFKSGLLITRGVALGAFINWLGQSIFAWLVFRYTSVQSKHAIVGQLFIGQIIKWVIVIAGFGLVLAFVTPISTGAVIFGFIAMQLGHFLILWALHKKS